MSTNKEEIRKAFDSFEEDDFMSAKDTLKKEIQDAISDYAQEKLNLEKPLKPQEDDAE